MTPTAFAILPEDEQAFMLGYEIYRAGQLADLREAMSDEDPKKSKLSPEVFTLIALERL